MYTVRVVNGFVDDIIQDNEACDGGQNVISVSSAHLPGLGGNGHVAGYTLEEISETRVRRRLSYSVLLQREKLVANLGEL